MAQRDKTHLIVSDRRSTSDYSPVQTGRDSAEIVAAPPDRLAHGGAIRSGLEAAAETARLRRAQNPVVVPDSIPGAYVVFESFPGVELALTSLDPRAGNVHPELRSSHIEIVNGERVEIATVFVPEGKMGYFLRLLDAYVASVSDPTVRRANRKLFDRVQAIGLASVEALWTDPRSEFPREQGRVWWEVWLRRRDGKELARLRAYASATPDVEVGRQALGFGTRTVVLVHASVAQIASAMDVLDDIAELRHPHYPAEFLAGEDASTQNEFVMELAQRVEPAGDAAPVVCVVDTGIYREHPLLSGSLSPEDCHAADPAWSREVDDRGHGTQMAGLALFGDLGAAIDSDSVVPLRHKLESLKLLPPGGKENSPELYGAITASGAAAVETQAPQRSRVYSMAVTAITPVLSEAEAEDAVHGAPTSWSASIDALAAGLGVIESTEPGEGIALLGPAEPEAHRLFLVSAGNVDRYEVDHLTRSDLEPVQDPAQAWNALTVGAYTDLDSLVDAPADYDGWSPLAPRGELSPFSRTSVMFDSKKWPVKPEIVLEGGNLAQSPTGSELHPIDPLSLLTTRAPRSFESASSSRLLDTANATSAATAQAAHLAGEIMAAYPSLWPESVRALIVHSAEWTAAMQSRIRSMPGKRGKRALLRRYGMGVPDLLRATRSASDALTLIVQDTITPFQSGTMREIHFHDLPWPTDVLVELGEVEVKLRVTLSYFIEPNAARRGWNGRYSYASHGLRFDVRRPTESNSDFQKRLNAKATGEEEKRPDPVNDTGEWIFGSELQRSSGSLHTDIWSGSAVDLAQRGALAVYPVGGWWKDATKNEADGREARYALIVSIETPEVDADIWTPVAAQIEVPTVIVT